MLRVQQNATSVNDTFVTVQCHGYEKQRKAELRVMTMQECYKKMGAACGHTGRLREWFARVTEQYKITTDAIRGVQ